MKTAPQASDNAERIARSCDRLRTGTETTSCPAVSRAKNVRLHSRISAKSDIR